MCSGGYSGSWWMPYVCSTANEVPGAASRSSRTTSSAVSRASARTFTKRWAPGRRAGRPRRRRCAQIARPWPWTWSLTTSIQRAGRPVTKKTSMPASSAAARAAIVRAETDLSSRSRVPSRSVAISRGGERAAGVSGCRSLRSPIHSPAYARARACGGSRTFEWRYAAAAEPRTLEAMRLSTVILPVRRWHEGGRDEWLASRAARLPHRVHLRPPVLADLPRRPLVRRGPDADRRGRRHRAAAPRHAGHLAELPAPGDPRQGADLARRHLRRPDHARHRRGRQRLRRHGAAARSPGRRANGPTASASSCRCSTGC